MKRAILTLFLVMAVTSLAYAGVYTDRIKTIVDEVNQIDNLMKKNNQENGKLIQMRNERIGAIKELQLIETETISFGSETISSEYTS